MRLLVNAQEIINISKVRLCTRAEKTTRIIWDAAISKLAEIEPILAKACVPSCIYRATCPEIKSCGFANTKEYLDKRIMYSKNLENEKKEFREV